MPAFSDRLEQQWTQVWAIQQRQHGLITVDQATACGLSDDQVAWARRTGRLLSARRGVLAAPGAPNTFRQEVLAAVLSAPASNGSHSTAATFLDMGPTGDSLIHLSIPYARTGSLPGVRLHRSVILPAWHLTTVDGIPITSRPRTLVDLAGVMREGRWLHLLDDQLAAHPGLIDQVESVAEHWCRRGRRGSTRVRLALAARVGGPIASATAIERKLRQVLDAGGLPEPVEQFRAPWMGPDERADAAYPAAKVVLEADSRRWHTRVADFEKDRRRDQAAAAHGWLVLRVTWNQLCDEPDEVADVVRRTMSARISA